MTPPLVVDAQGNALIECVHTDEAGLSTAAALTPCPLALVVVVEASTGDVLFGLNRWRRQHELPGGMIEAGESARSAAIRELDEETGIVVETVALVGYARFELVDPERRELGAIYTAGVIGAAPQPSDELTSFLWRQPSSATTAVVSPIDDAIARWTLDTRQRRRRE